MQVPLRGDTLLWSFFAIPIFPIFSILIASWDHLGPHRLVRWAVARGRRVEMPGVPVAA